MPNRKVSKFSNLKILFAKTFKKIELIVGLAAQGPLLLIWLKNSSQTLLYIMFTKTSNSEYKRLSKLISML